MDERSSERKEKKLNRNDTSENIPPAKRSLKLSEAVQ